MWSKQGDEITRQKSRFDLGTELESSESQSLDPVEAGFLLTLLPKWNPFLLLLPRIGLQLHVLLGELSCPWFL